MIHTNMPDLTLPIPFKCAHLHSVRKPKNNLRHREKMLHTERLLEYGSNMQPSCCEATVMTILCHPCHSHFNKFAHFLERPKKDIAKVCPPSTCQTTILQSDTTAGQTAASLLLNRLSVGIMNNGLCV